MMMSISKIASIGISLCTLCILMLGEPRVSVLSQNKPTGPMLKTATRHPMQYYISFPEGWTSDKKWPIVVTVTGGLKNFQSNAELFASARKNLPFIIVTPVNLTNGGSVSDFRKLPEYNYAQSVWDDVDKTGWCDFDEKGLDAVIEDVQKQFSGEAKYFIAGHSAGGHMVWMTVLMHPEKLAGAATTGGNFTNRCIGVISNAPERVNLPVRGFRGDLEGEPATSPDKEQFFTAKALANAHGFTNLSYELVKGQHHNPMPDRVLAYFYGLLNSGNSR